MSDKLKFYAYESWETSYANQKWEIGDKKELPTMFGYSLFTLVEKKPDELTWKSGDLLAHFERDGENWKWNHCLIDAKAIACVGLVV